MRGSFAPRQFGLAGTSQGGNPIRAAFAALPDAGPAPEPAPVREIRPPHPRHPAWLQKLHGHVSAIDWAVDLADDVGSHRWLRGIGTFVALGLAAFTLWPGLTPVQAAAPIALDDPAETAFAAAATRPLALVAKPLPGRAMSALATPLADMPARASVTLTAILASGDNLAALLNRVGVQPGDAARAAELVAAALPDHRIEPGTPLTITLGQADAYGTARALAGLRLHAKFDMDLALTRVATGLAVAKVPIAFDSTPLRIEGVVGQSLYRSARDAGAPASAVQAYLRQLASHDALDDIAPGDEFDMVLAYRRSAGGASEPGDLLYAGLSRDGQARNQLVRWGKGGEFVDTAAPPEPAAPAESDSLALGAPVAGHVTSSFGLRRHPILGYVRLHAGIDFAAPWGSPVHATNDGLVSYVGWHGGHGNYVRIEHGGGLATGYGHMSRFAVAPGTRVMRGQVIGYVGSTGLSTGPHLHYELYRDGRPVDPDSARFIVRHTVEAVTGSLDAVKARLKQLLAITPGAALKPFEGK